MGCVNVVVCVPLYSSVPADFLQCALGGVCVVFKSQLISQEIKVYPGQGEGDPGV